MRGAGTVIYYFVFSHFQVKKEQWKNSPYVTYIKDSASDLVYMWFSGKPLSKKLVTQHAIHWISELKLLPTMVYFSSVGLELCY